MESDFGSIAKSTLADKIAKQITRMVRNNDYEPGDRLPTISEMSDHFGVGPPTLREALKKLETLGILQVKHGSGVYVRKNEDLLFVSNPMFFGDVSKDILLDLVETRLLIETKSARLAAENASSDQIERMRELLEKAENNFEDDETLTEANMAFHRQITVASGNVVVGQILEVLSTLFEHEQRTILNIHGSRERDHEEHLDIFGAIQARDESLAEQRMQAHLEGVREIIQKWDPEQSPISEE